MNAKKRSKSHTITAVGRAFNRDGSSIGRLKKRFLENYARNEEIQNKYQQLEQLAPSFCKFASLTPIPFT